MIDNQKVLMIMKIAMVCGVCLLLLGHYLLSYTSFAETHGITGLMISGGMMAIGLILSLPTKMYLTFVFVKGENERKERARKAKLAANSQESSSQHKAD